MKNLESKLNIRWFNWIPILGVMLYEIAFEMKLATSTIEDKNGRKIRSTVKKYKSLWALAFLIISLPFGIVFITFKVQNHEWTWWALGTSLSLLLIQHSNPLMYKKMYLKGLNNLQFLNEK